MRYERPTVRGFVARAGAPSENISASAWISRGGIAVVGTLDFDEIFLGVKLTGFLSELHRCALGDLEIVPGSSDVTVDENAEMTPHFYPLDEIQREIVREWVLRDAAVAEPTTFVDLDCQTCGACCRDNEVRLSKRELQTIRETVAADRDLWSLRKGHRTFLRLLSEGPDTQAQCVFLKNTSDSRVHCSVYEARPAPCRAFLAASESCLAVRQEDGVTTATR